MQTTFENLNLPHLPSGTLWRGFAPPTSFGPTGTTTIAESGNPAFGFYDNFHSFHASTLEGPYLLLRTDAGCTIDQIADTATEKGLLQFGMDGGAANDEAVMQWGRGLAAPFKLADRDLVFECRLNVSAITGASWSIGAGLGEVSMGATDGFFADAGALADKNFLGFNKLVAETAEWDGAYKADGQTYQDGATKTKLNALHTAVANTYVKLGFRYRANPQTVEFFVNGKLAGDAASPARLTASEITAATFPGDVFLAPIVGVKAVATTAVNVKLDWIACAQLL